MFRKLGGLFAIMIVAAALTGCSDPQHRILYSTSPNRTNAHPLQGARITGLIYVFYDRQYESNTRSVQFFVDVNKKKTTDTAAPFDLNGGTATAANPYDPRQLGRGKHIIAIGIDRIQGSNLNYTASFTVAPPTGTTSTTRPHTTTSTTRPHTTTSTTRPHTTTSTTTTTRPGTTTRVLSGHVVLHGATIPAGQTWQFDPNVSTLVETDANIVVYGKLVMKPANPGITHTLRFINIDENKFVGGGMDVLPTDVGLWVMGAGQLDVAGAAKTAWTHLANAGVSGDRTITLRSIPAGWRVGDEISVAPTSMHDYQGFDLATITAMSGRTVTLNRGLTYDHWMVNKEWTAEVMNLTRNVNIEGTGDGGPLPKTNGRTHIFIRSTRPQSIKYVTIRHTGPRPYYIDKGRPVGEEPKWPSKMETFGRYALHFHHNMDGSRGTIVEGTVVRDAGNHAYVPHMSDGITFKDTISYNTMEDAYWYDGTTLTQGGLATWREFSKDADPTNDLTLEHVIAARVMTGGNGVRLSGFELGLGTGNSIRDSVAVGVDPDINSNGFEWPEAADGVWTFDNNVAHNNGTDGIFGWQNSFSNHVITNFTAYHNDDGIFLGAYQNKYQFIGGTLYGNHTAGIYLKAASLNGQPIRFVNYVIDGEGSGRTGIQTGEHKSQGVTPTLFKNVTFRDFGGRAAVLVNAGGIFPDSLVFDNPSFDSNPFWMLSSPAGENIRVQNGNTAYKVSMENGPGGVWVPIMNGYKTTIQPFL